MYRHFFRKFGLIVSIALAVGIGSPQSAWGGFEEGADAFNRGKFTNALKVLKPLAEQGDATAQKNLGLMYKNGIGVPKDYKLAVKWFRKSAEQGFARAQFNMGSMYGDGYGVPQDYELAVEWYRKSVEQGNANAQTNLGLMYETGQGVPKDYELALKWYRKAVKWYRKSADQGYANAQKRLGCMYDKGKGVLKDYVLAYMWFNISATNGNESGREYRDIMEEKMTPEHIGHAQQLTREWMEKHKKK